MKKYLALALAIIMILALSVPAFADDPVLGSITVTDPKVAAGEETTTYEIYRIFDMTANADFSTMVYTISTKWAGFFTGTAAGAGYILDTNDTTANGGQGYTPIVVGGDVKYIGLTDSNIAEFAKAALEYSQKTPVTNDGENTTGSFADLPLGYYMVYPKGANLNVGDYTSIVSLTTTKPNASVVQKAEFPTLEKTDDDDSVEVGQEVTYTLTSKVPDTTGFDTFDFTFHDQMTKGLTFNGADDITVTIGSGATAVTVPATSENGSHYVYATETPGTGYETAFKITIPVMKYQDHIGETITVTYKATVNSDAISSVEKNHATLEYSNNPQDDEDKTTTPPDEEEVFTAKIVIDKRDGSNSSAKLAGAKFILRCKSVADATDGNATAEPGKYYVYDSTNDTVSWVAETAIDAKVTGNNAALESDIANGATVVTTLDDGSAVFAGLENGVYELIEVEAPAGYNQIKGVAAEVTVAGEAANTATLTVTTPVDNNSGTELPSTGGIGTTIFYVLGGLLVACAGVLLITKTRMRREG